MKKIAFLLALLISVPAYADSMGSVSGGAAGNQSNLGGGLCQASPVALSNGQQASVLIDCTTHALVVVGAGAGGSTLVTQPTASLLNATVNPGSRTLVTLDIKTVTTGATAVNAISAGHRTAGGFLQNPVGAAVALCINEIGTAVGTTSSGDTTCIQPGQSYNVAPASTAVSVISSDSAHPFSGYGMQ